MQGDSPISLTSSRLPLAQTQFPPYIEFKQRFFKFVDLHCFVGIQMSKCWPDVKRRCFCLCMHGPFIVKANSAIVVQRDGGCACLEEVRIFKGDIFDRTAARHHITNASQLSGDPCRVLFCVEKHLEKSFRLSRVFFSILNFSCHEAKGLLIQGHRLLRDERNRNKDFSLRLHDAFTRRQCPLWSDILPQETKQTITPKTKFLKT